MEANLDVNFCVRGNNPALSNRSCGIARTFMAIAATLFFVALPAHSSTTQFFSGNLRTNATVTSCGSGCTLGASNTDGDYAQWAAVVNTFQVYTTTTMEAISYSFGGGTSLTGASVAAGGLEPYLSLFDSGGNFLSSTFFGTTCPPGSGTVGGNCYDVELDGGILTPGVYSIALTAYENMSSAENGSGSLLSDGFTGLGNLGNGENLNYAFDVVLPENVPPVVPSVPEPSPAILLTTGGVLLAFLQRKRVFVR